MTFKIDVAPPNDDGQETQEVCHENIGIHERRKRVAFGVGMTVITLALSAAMLAIGVPRGWRALLFFPFAAAATGFFQAYEKT